MPPALASRSARSWGAIALGAVFAAGTAASIFWDVRALVDLTPDHMMTALVLVGTIASAHMWWQQLRACHFGACFLLAILFGGGTFYCVTTSAARNVEVSVPKALDVLAANEGRRQLEMDIREAKEDARKAKASAAKNCANGEGPGCKALTKLADAADSHYWMLGARLAGTRPEQPANPGLHHAAEVFAALPFAGSAGAIEHGLVLFSPFVKALFLEIATVVFFGIGLGHRTGAKVARVAEGLPKASTIVERLPAIGNDLTSVRDALSKVGTPVTNMELAELMGVSPGEASRRATVALESGTIDRQRFGKRVAISLRQLN